MYSLKSQGYGWCLIQYKTSLYSEARCPLEGVPLRVPREKITYCSTLSMSDKIFLYGIIPSLQVQRNISLRVCQLGYFASMCRSLGGASLLTVLEEVLVVLGALKNKTVI